jgi:hypothetical protein
MINLGYNISRVSYCRNAMPRGQILSIDKERYYEVTQPISVEGLAGMLQRMGKRFGEPQASFNQFMDFASRMLELQDRLGEWLVEANHS